MTPSTGHVPVLGCTSSFATNPANSRSGASSRSGVALRDSHWHELRDLWQAALTTHGWPVEREVKWHGIRTGEVPPALADAVVAALSRSPLRSYVTLLDIELGISVAPEFFASDEDTYGPGSCSLPNASSFSSKPQTTAE